MRQTPDLEVRLEAAMTRAIEELYSLDSETGLRIYNPEGLLNAPWRPKPMTIKKLGDQTGTTSSPYGPIIECRQSNIRFTNLHAAG
jgi:hypothetical protein